MSRSKLLKIHETTKLFYDEYPYKLSILNSLGHIFREKNFKSARDQLDELQLMYERSEPLVRGSHRVKTYDVDTFKECKKLFAEFTSRDDYKLRIENPVIQVYSHDRDWLIKLASIVDVPLQFFEPKTVLEKNTILVSTPTNYEYKVTLSTTPDPGLATWILNNPTLAKAGPVFLEEVRNSGYTKGLYFYVRDEKILNLVNLMLGKSSRIDKLVYKQDLDK